MWYMLKCVIGGIALGAVFSLVLIPIAHRGSQAPGPDYWSGGATIACTSFPCYPAATQSPTAAAVSQSPAAAQVQAPASAEPEDSGGGSG